MGIESSAGMMTEAVWVQFRVPLQRYIRGHVNDEQTAADLLQDVFVKIHQRLDSVREDERLEGWLYRVARNTVYDYYRTSHPHVEISENWPVADTPEAADEVESRLAMSLHMMLSSLPPEYALALRLTDLEGVSQQELAVRLGLSVSGVKSRVQRARKMLRAALLACCHFEFDRRGRVIDYHPHRCNCQAECAC
ncbi:MAG TPA: RNA polymerase sigma factor SigZ [Candidatus Limnocylindrales bacterium]|nr:RNA polymerase sigma factor SigZ [Candidatus Limnocylindrales bacterium]